MITHIQRTTYRNQACIAAVYFHTEFVRSDHPETIPDRADFAQAFYCAMMGTY